MRQTAGNAVSTIRSRAKSSENDLKWFLSRLWDVYSKASPSGREVPILLSLCSSCAMLTGGLLFHWLSVTLQYSRKASVQISCVYAAGLLLVSFLCHPLRCVLTMILPIVSTQQGRKLLISASVMILALNVVPNISANVGAVARILKCTAEGFTKTLFNSSVTFNEARQDLVEKTIGMGWDDFNIVNTLKAFNTSTRVDVSEVKRRFVKVMGEIEEHFSQSLDVLGEYKLMLNRTLAVVFVALLVLESARYLASYLTTVQFDNGFKFKDNTPSVEEKKQLNVKAKLLSASCFITSKECTSSLVSLILVTLYFAAIALIVALDYVVYNIVQMVVPWVLDFPPTTASINVNYKVEIFFPALCLIPGSCTTRPLKNFEREYKWNYKPESSLCAVKTSAPHAGVTLLLGCLWAMSYMMVFLEVYAKRLCRNICASFYREQEERRTAWRKAQERPSEGESLRDSV